MIEHHFPVTVYYKDVDQMGIVYYTRYLEYFEMARTECLRSIGLSVTDLEGKGLYLPVSECSLRYHRGARFEDRLDVCSQIATVPRARLTIDYTVTDGAGQTLVTGRTIHAIVNKKGKPIRAPKILLDAIETHLTGEQI
ncbi:MAG: acyl-CoA thioesterase [Candidatus Neomarinimicrobiota bacterium]|nr:MAG: acyl-CoA thioesterase [Candidatus Neomarinimicrobiota bacterium]